MKQEFASYTKIEKIVIDNLKNEAKCRASTKINNWAGDAYLTKKQLADAIKYRKRLNKGSKMLLNALKILGY